MTFAGFPHTGSYRGPSGAWSAGDVREVDDETADYLTGTFPQAFHSAVLDPPKPKKAAADLGMPAALEGSVKALRAELASGSLDDVLDVLAAAERSHKNRSSALAAIADRKAEVAG